MGEKGQYCDLGGTICLPEEEFGQLYGHQRTAGRALNVDRKVGSDEWGESVPSTCDWRKATGVISSIKDQVSIATLPGSVEPVVGGRRGQGLDPLPSPLILPIRKTASAAGPWQQPATSKPYGPLKRDSLWKSLCKVRLGAGACVLAGGWAWGFVTHTVPSCTRAT